jgi:hypothetical protein
MAQLHKCPLPGSCGSWRRCGGSVCSSRPPGDSRHPCYRPGPSEGALDQLQSRSKWGVRELASTRRAAHQPSDPGRQEAAQQNVLRQQRSVQKPQGTAKRESSQTVDQQPIMDCTLQNFKPLKCGVWRRVAAPLPPSLHPLPKPKAENQSAHGGGAARTASAGDACDCGSNFWRRRHCSSSCLRAERPGYGGRHNARLQRFDHQQTPGLADPALLSVRDPIRVHPICSEESE